MADEDKSSKTERPTSKRLSEAKRKGQVAQSQEVKTWAVLLASSIGLVLLIPLLMGNVRDLNATFIRDAHAFKISPTNLQSLFVDIAYELMLMLAPMILLLVATALVASVAQVGWTFSWEKVEMKWGAFSPAKGIKRIIGIRALVEAGKGIAKFAVVGLVALFLLAPFMDDLQLFPVLDITATLDRVETIAVLLAFGSVAVMTAVAIIDYIYQKWQHTENLKMSKQEVKDERKQADGDPMVKQRIARIRTERAQRRMLQNMGKADVVITNPTHYAVALEYKPETMNAPVLIAKGVDSMAQRIREAAEEHEVPIVENPPLARALHSAVELDEEIPPEHYHAVAEVIGYVYRLKGKMPQADAQTGAAAS